MTTLADLRRESLAEQKADMAAALPQESESETVPDAHLRIQADAQMLTQASEQVRADASTGASASALKQVRPRSSTRAGKAASTEVSTPARTSASEDVSLEEIVRTALEQKRQHPGGTKASVDMSPELSLRIKRYGLDHGGVTSRQLFLELATAFLDREGY